MEEREIDKKHRRKKSVERPPPPRNTIPRRMYININHLVVHF